MLHLEKTFAILQVAHMASDLRRNLRSCGCKITEPRRLVLEALDEATGPLSPYDIQKLLRTKGKLLNVVTIYRVLSLFCSLNLSHKLSQGGFVKCTLGDQVGCHRFTICRHCGGLQEFSSPDLCRQEQKIAWDLGFHSEQHLSETLGLCARCYGSGL
jgi:Fur family transcriptional regulator, zinc uptake regulator